MGHLMNGLARILPLKRVISDPPRRLAYDTNAMPETDRRYHALADLLEECIGEELAMVG